MKDKKLFNAKVREAVLNANAGEYTPGDIQDAFTEIFDKCAPQQYYLIKFNTYEGEQKIVANNIYLEDYNCTNYILTLNALDDIFGVLPNITRQKILLFSDDASILYDDIHSFLRKYFGNTLDAETFLDEVVEEIKADNQDTH